MSRTLRYPKALLVAAIAFVCVLTTGAAQAWAEAPSAGHWKLSDEKPQVITSNNDFAGASGVTSNNAYFYQRSASVSEHAETVSYRWYRYWTGVGIYTYDWKGGAWSPHAPERDEEVHTDTATFVATVSEPPSVVEAGGLCTFTLTLNMTKSDCYYDDSSGLTYSHLKASSKMVANYDYYLSHRSAKSWFTNTEEGGPTGCYVSVDNYAMGGQSIGEPPNVTECEVSAKFPSGPGSISLMTDAAEGKGSGDKITVAFVGCGSDTVWTYEWVPGETTDTDTSEPVTIIQKKETDADDRPGSVTTDILPEIEEGVDELDIPRLAAIAGVVVVGSVAITSLLKRRKASEPQPKERSARPKEDDDAERKTPKSYRMVVSKDFGNKLRAGDKPREVRVRIEESTDHVSFSPNARMTEAIQATGLQHLSAQPYGVSGTDKVVRIAVSPQNGTAHQAAGQPGASTVQPILRLTYTGKGGTFVNDVKFQLADEPVIVFLDLGTGRELARDRMDVDVLDDGEETVFGFEVRNFLNEPQSVTITPSDRGVFADCASEGDEWQPNLHRGTLRNGIPLDSPYGTWPLEREFLIVAYNEEERAEATVQAKVWPEGFFFDTRHVPSDWVHATRPGHILVDTSPLEAKGAGKPDRSLATVRVSLGVGLRDKDGAVVIDRPTLPEGETFFRLQADDGDEAASKLLDPGSSRFWYDLVLRAEAAHDAADPRLGTLTLSPFFPIVTKAAGARFACLRRLLYRGRDGAVLKGQVDFVLTGLSYEDVNTGDRRKIVSAINRLLAGRQYHDMAHVREVFERYGLPAAPQLTLLGSRAEVEAAGRSAETLMRELELVMSVERLRLVYEELYWASYTCCEEDGLEFHIRLGDVDVYRTTVRWSTVGETYDKLCLTAKGARFTCNIALAMCWFVIERKYPKVAHLEYLLNPLYSYLTEYCEKYSEYLTIGAWSGEYIDEGERDRMGALDKELTASNFFSARRLCTELVCPFIENELLGYLVGQGTKLCADEEQIVKAVIAIGTIGCLMFAKNVFKCMTFNERTQRNEIDFWRAINMTVSDISVFTFKVVIAVLFAHMLERVRSQIKIFDESRGLRTSGSTAPDGAPVIDESDLEGKVFAAFFKGATWISDKIDRSADYVLETMSKMNQSGGLEKAKALVESTAIETEATVRRECSMFDSFDEWAKGLGSVRMSVKNRGDAEPTVIEVPYLTYLYMCVDMLFQKSGLQDLECFKLDYKTILPKDCPYMPRDERIRVLERLGAYSEVRYLAGEGSLDANPIPPNISISGSTRFPVQR